MWRIICSRWRWKSAASSGVVVACWSFLSQFWTFRLCLQYQACCLFLRLRSLAVTCRTCGTVSGSAARRQRWALSAGTGPAWLPCWMRLLALQPAHHWLAAYLPSCYDRCAGSSTVGLWRRPMTVRGRSSGTLPPSNRDLWCCWSRVEDRAQILWTFAPVWSSSSPWSSQPYPTTGSQSWSSSAVLVTKSWIACLYQGRTERGPLSLFWSASAYSYFDGWSISKAFAASQSSTLLATIATSNPSILRRTQSWPPWTDLVALAGTSPLPCDSSPCLHLYRASIRLFDQRKHSSNRQLCNISIAFWPICSHDLLFLRA